MSSEEDTAQNVANSNADNYEEYAEYTETATNDMPMTSGNDDLITEEQLNEWENEAALLTEGDAEGEENKANSTDKDGSAVGEAKNSAEIDSRSVYVGNVDYSTTDAQLTDFFSSCGRVVRVTIPVDRFTQQPKAFAYVEFETVDAAAAAVYLSETELNGRALKIQSKRTNIPQFKGPGGSRGARGAFRGGAPGGFRGRGRGGFMPQVVMMPYGFAPGMYMGGAAPRGRGRGAPRGGARGGRGRFMPH